MHCLYLWDPPFCSVWSVPLVCGGDIIRILMFSWLSLRTSIVSSCVLTLGCAFTYKERLNHQCVIGEASLVGARNHKHNLTLSGSILTLVNLSVESTSAVIIDNFQPKKESTGSQFTDTCIYRMLHTFLPVSACDLVAVRDIYLKPPFSNLDYYMGASMLRLLDA